MIIIEGCDGTGKTILAKYLCQKLKFVYKKRPPFRNPLNNYLAEGLVKNDNVVFDRFFISEGVYSQVKGRAEFPIWYQQLIERQFLRTNSVIIHCVGNVPDIKKTLKIKSENFIKLNEVSLVCRLFKQRIKNSLLPVIEYDYKKDYPYSVFLKLERILKDKRAKAFERYSSIGSVEKGCIMLVGDVSNGAKKAFYTSRGGAMFLHEALSFNDEKYYITNSRKFLDEGKDVNALKREFMLLNPKRVIALGKNAADMLDKAKIHCKETFHPQFMKRFRNKEVKWYAKQLLHG